MGDILIGCSGWSYAEPAEKGGWTRAFYPDSKTRRLAFYAQFFDTVEMDSTFYEKVTYDQRYFLWNDKSNS